MLKKKGVSADRAVGPRARAPFWSLKTAVGGARARGPKAICFEQKTGGSFIFERKVLSLRHLGIQKFHL